MESSRARQGVCGPLFFAPPTAIGAPLNLSPGSDLRKYLDELAQSTKNRYVSQTGPSVQKKKKTAQKDLELAPERQAPIKGAPAPSYVCYANRKLGQRKRQLGKPGATIGSSWQIRGVTIALHPHAQATGQKKRQKHQYGKHAMIHATRQRHTCLP